MIVLTTDKTLSRDQIASLRHDWIDMGYTVRNLERAMQGQRPPPPWPANGWNRQPYYPPPPLSAWVTMDPLVKLMVIALPVMTLLALVLLWP